ncbi:MAG: hypothetical protein K8S99_15515 [Planctomycetes bacterium]|nr:hypothetical protein [Planctomycetota bacterium]
MSVVAHVLRLLAVTAIVMSIAGCGYAHKELFPQNVRSVAVPIFENRTFYQGIEFDMTEALTKEIELRTPYKVVAEAGADTQLRGTIVSVNQTVLSHRPDGNLPEELDVHVTINFEWKDLRTGEIIRSRKGFDRVARYIPTRSPVSGRAMSETYSIGQHQAVQSLAQEIVSVMRADW